MTSRVSFYFVDVFASRPLTGNPLSLIPDADGLGLDDYHLFHAIRGDLLARLGRAADARQAFQAAARLTQTQREHDYLLARRDALISPE